jgi:subtilase family serine protease
VAIVDAYGYPAAASDLAVYRKSMGLPSCAPSSGCLKIVNQNGRTSPLPKPSADSSEDWRAEEAVDLQMVSALCPNCKLLLVQASSNKNSDLGAGVNAAAALGAVAISNSYRGDESGASDAAYSHSGRALTASAGEDGSAKQPCTFSGVVCVGGTTLTDPPGRGWIERPWRSAGACSALVAKPAWQRTHGCATRSVPDAAAVADPNTGVAFYEAAGGGWQEAGGTGVASPLVAALFALEPSAARSNAPAWLWRHGRKTPKLGGT